MKFELVKTISQATVFANVEAALNATTRYYSTTLNHDVFALAFSPDGVRICFPENLLQGKPERWLTAVEAAVNQAPETYDLTALINDEFMECDTCRAKPGSPRLCDGCLHNRRAMTDMQARLLAVKSAMEGK